MRVLVALAVLVAVTSAFVVVNNANLVECEMCEIAVRTIEPTLEKDTEGVEHIFVKECEKKIPGKIGEKECTNYANKEFGKIINELESGTAPKDVCTKLHTC